MEGLMAGGDADTCDMVTNLYIPPFIEIFNTYGEDLSNAQLLARYGFALSDGNDNDIVSWDLDELEEIAASLSIDNNTDDALGTPCSGSTVTFIWLIWAHMNQTRPRSCGRTGQLWMHGREKTGDGVGRVSFTSRRKSFSVFPLAATTTTTATQDTN